VNPITRPPPKVLLVHNGSGYDAHVKHLADAGLHVSETHADSAVADATSIQPDVIVLDFGCDGDVTRELKAHPPTKHIPVIALVELMPER
jgi:CheY-like chemotaxis protein